MRSILVLTVCLFAFTAYANNSGNGGNPHDQDQEQGQNQGQGQHQGQGQGQDQYQSSHSYSTSRSTSGSYAGSEVGNVTANVEVSNPKPAVSSAPDVYVASCNRGISGQMYDAGGSLGSKDPVCTYLDLSVAARAAGDVTLANELFARAVSEANTRHFFTRVFSWLPVIGFLF